MYYETWDCTAAINQHVGEGSSAHAMGATLGNGWYAQSTVKVGKPELLLRLAIEFADGSVQDVVSSPSGWLAHRGPYTPHPPFHMQIPAIGAIARCVGYMYRATHGARRTPARK